MGARAARKITNSSTRMNRIENSWIWLLCLVDCFWLATWVGIWPARLTRRSPGSDVLSMAAWRSATSRLVPVWSNGVTVETTSSWAAWPSGAVPRKFTPVTVGTCRRLAESVLSAAWSASDKVAPEVSATTCTWLWLVEPMRGSASLAAWVLGALAGRKSLLLLFTWLPRVGKACAASAVPMIQTTTITQRRRTTQRPRAPNMAFMQRSPFRSFRSIHAFLELRPRVPARRLAPSSGTTAFPRSPVPPVTAPPTSVTSAVSAGITSSARISSPSSSASARSGPMRARARRIGASLEARTASLSWRCSGATETTVRRRSAASSCRSTRPASASWVTSRLAVERANPSRSASSETVIGPSRAIRAIAPMWRGARYPLASRVSTAWGIRPSERSPRASRPKASSSSDAWRSAGGRRRTARPGRSGRRAGRPSAAVSRSRARCRDFRTVLTQK